MSSSRSWEETSERVREYAGYKCEFCRKPQGECPRSLDVHHIWPRQDGGSDYEGNLVALCRSCHQSIESWTRLMIRHPTPDNVKQRIRLEVAKRRDRTTPAAIPRLSAELYRFHHATTG